MQWARTGARITQKEWLEDSLAGLVWFLGVFLALGIFALARGTKGTRRPTRASGSPPVAPAGPRGAG
jgi:hypothetical protein